MYPIRWHVALALLPPVLATPRIEVQSRSRPRGQGQHLKALEFIMLKQKAQWHDSDESVMTGDMKLGARGNGETIVASEKSVW